jgi:hypothetical protein
MSESELQFTIHRMASTVRRNGIASLATELPWLRDRHMRAAVRQALRGCSGLELVCICEANLVTLPDELSMTPEHKQDADLLRSRFFRQLATIIDPEWDFVATRPMVRCA